MARGWESKSVEEQMADRASDLSAGQAGKVPATRNAADRSRARQALELQRENVLNQRTSSADRRAALAAALTQIEQQLAALAEEA